MRATWRVMSAISMPQASGSSKARRSETCSAPSTMTARNTSTPPCSIAAGGTFSASNTGTWLDPGMALPCGRLIGVLDLGSLGRTFRRLADRFFEGNPDALDRFVLGAHLLVREGARHMARRIDEHQPPQARIVEGAPQREMQAAVMDRDAHHLVGVLPVDRRRRLYGIIGHRSPSTITDGFGRIDDFGDGRQRQLFEISRVGHRHVLPGDARNRRIEIVERALHDPGGDFGAD